MQRHSAFAKFEDSRRQQYEIGIVSVDHSTPLAGRYKCAFSRSMNSRLSGPPRLPSPRNTSLTSRHSDLNLHLRAKSSGRDFVIAWTAYFPITGKNLKALHTREHWWHNSDVNTNWPLPPVARKRFSCSGWWSRMESPVGVSLYQQTATRSNFRSANTGRISRRLSRSRSTPSAGAKLARLCRGVVGGADSPRPFLLVRVYPQPWTATLRKPLSE